MRWHYTVVKFFLKRIRSIYMPRSTTALSYRFQRVVGTISFDLRSSNAGSIIGRLEDKCVFVDKELLERMAREVKQIFCAVQPASWRLIIGFPRSSGKRMSRISVVG